MAQHGWVHDLWLHAERLGQLEFVELMEMDYIDESLTRIRVAGVAPDSSVQIWPQSVKAKEDSRKKVDPAHVSGDLLGMIGRCRQQGRGSHNHQHQHFHHRRRRQQQQQHHRHRSITYVT